MQKIDNFINENSNLIYEYINKEILKDIGAINKDFFLQKL